MSRGDLSSLAILGEIRVEGDTALLTELAACFRAGESALSVRLRCEPRSIVDGAGTVR
jgi:hypothetical protein